MIIIINMIKQLPERKTFLILWKMCKVVKFYCQILSVKYIICVLLGITLPLKNNWKFAKITCIAKNTFLTR